MAIFDEKDTFAALSVRSFPESSDTLFLVPIESFRCWVSVVSLLDLLDWTRIKNGRRNMKKNPLREPRAARSLAANSRGTKNSQVISRIQARLMQFLAIPSYRRVVWYFRLRSILRNWVNKGYRARADIGIQRDRQKYLQAGDQGHVKPGKPVVVFESVQNGLIRRKYQKSWQGKTLCIQITKCDWAEYSNNHRRRQRD